MKPVTILVTGLCLSRNRGGPAMAVCFMDQVQKHLPDLKIKFIFAVRADYIDLEKEWAEVYGVEVVPRDSLVVWWQNRRGVSSLVHAVRRQRDGSLRDPHFWRRVHFLLEDAYRRSDCVINMSGIAFVGDGTTSWRGAINGLTDSTYCRKYKRPFLRFIQSYGPFNDWRVRFLARMEFSRLPYVFARGELSASYCREVAGKVPVYAFPDIAITLNPAKEEWRDSYLRGIGLASGKYICLSPSAVMRSKPTRSGSSLGEKHAETFTILAKHYMGEGKRVLFVPHMTSPEPRDSDRAVCEEIINSLLASELGSRHKISLVSEELDCQELKALIGGAQSAIVSRYHALVACVSMGIPVVALGWNIKYQDLLNFYKCPQFAVDARDGEPAVIAKMVLDKAGAWTDDQVLMVRNIQLEMENMVDKACKMCADWILNATGD